LVDSQVSGGLSGAELIAACRDAALLAMEEYEETEDTTKDPMIRMDHLLHSLTGRERQITPGMLDFYSSFQGAHSHHEPY
jgi:SpoVK/Ycf46/Vps4 family AAA+-type ATPase